MGDRKRNKSGRTARASRTTRGRRRSPWWVSLSDDELLDVRICDLGVKIEGSVLQKRIDQVQRELEKRHLTFRPHFWLSGDWFTPDGIPGAAIPFFLAHARLKRLETKQMLEAEGGTCRWFMQLLRHEVGHAICNAYRLNRRRAWQKIFGKSSRPYPTYYKPKPYSKKFVLHLDYWYAQSHPAEDFAETFAIWLTPGSQWRKRYADWPALGKLEFVDELMRAIAGKRPVNRSRERCETLRTMRTTLRVYYRRKRARYADDHPAFYNRDLRRLFVEGGRRAGREPASRFLKQAGPELRRIVAEWTGQSEYAIDLVLKEMTNRVRQLKLQTRHSRRRMILETAVLLTVQTMNYVHSGYFRVAL